MPWTSQHPPLAGVITRHDRDRVAFRIRERGGPEPPLTTCVDLDKLLNFLSASSAPSENGNVIVYLESKRMPAKLAQHEGKTTNWPHVLTLDQLISRSFSFVICKEGE